MSAKVIMPKLGLIMLEGTIVEWKIKEGDSVDKGTPLFSVDSEKVVVDVNSPASGVLRKIFAAPGSTVVVGGLLAIIAEPNEALDLHQMTQEAEKSSVDQYAVSVQGSSPKVTEAATDRERGSMSPSARRLAREHNVDVSRIVGTGPGGRIQKEDILKAVEMGKMTAVPPGQPSVDRVIQMSTMRSTIIERLSQSYTNALHVTLQMETDFSELMKLKQKLTDHQTSTHPSFTDLIVKAVALALREHQLLNSTIEGSQVKIFKEINIGIAVALDNGLVVPVVKNADFKKIDEIAKETRSLIERAKEGKLTLEDVTGGTFTITNLGVYGIDSFAPIINPPEAAILAVGRIIEKTAVVQRQICIRPMAILTLTFDHRILDGAQAAQFLSKLVAILASPVSLG